MQHKMFAYSLCEYEKQCDMMCDLEGWYRHAFDLANYNVVVGPIAGSGIVFT